MKPGGKNQQDVPFAFSGHLKSLRRQALASAKAEPSR